MGWEAEVVPDPDVVLSQPGDAIATADSGRSPGHYRRAGVDRLR